MQDRSRESQSARYVGAPQALNGSTGARRDNAPRYRTIEVDGVDIFYREAGPPNAPTVLLLHGFPTSSHMYRDLIPILADYYHVIAPDYPGYGSSEAPPADRFDYTFDRLAEVIEAFIAALRLERFVLYMQDFGGPVGFRIATKDPDRIAGLVIQNAVAHEQGLSQALQQARPFWEKRTPETEGPMRAFLNFETTRYQYLAGASEPEKISPDAWLHAQAILDRPGNDQVQLALLHDYGSNLIQYPTWQAYLRRHLPPLLVVWGANDPFFTVDGARAYSADVPSAELHLLDSGHFALEEHSAAVAELMLRFLNRIFASSQSID